MENTKQPTTIPYFIHEAEMDRLERLNKRWFITALIIFIAFIVTNAGWLYYESQFEDQTITQTITQDSGEGGNNTYNGKVIGGDYNGEATDTDNGQETP